MAKKAAKKKAVKKAAPKAVKKAAKKKAVKKAAKKKAKVGPMAGTATGAKKLTQTQIINALAEKCDVNKKVAKQLVDELADLAVRETKKHGVFVVPGLGRLVKSERKARTGRNPATGETIKIPKRTVVKFRVSKATAESIVPPKKK